jgi:hypothetical protein
MKFICFSKGLNDLLSPLSLPTISTKLYDQKNVYCIIRKHGNEIFVNQVLAIYIDALNIIYRL